MKILIILCLTIWLQATCTDEQSEQSNSLFYEASYEKNVLKQIGLLEKSLHACFSFEVEVSLLKLKVSACKSKEEKLKLYDQMLESLSLIQNNDLLVRAEQNRVNRALLNIHKKDNPELAIIYAQKIDAQEIEEPKSLKDYAGWIFFGFLLFLFIFFGFRLG